MDKTNQKYRVDFDGVAEFSLDELFADPDADNFFTRDELANMTIGQTLRFGGGAQPIGTIERIQ